MAMSQTEIETMIRDAFPDARIEVKDLAGDGNHYAATVSVQGQESGPPAPDGLRGAEGPDGRRIARPGADDVGELTGFPDADDATAWRPGGQGCIGRTFSNSVASSQNADL
jgi:hypothetical protein